MYHISTPLWIMASRYMLAAYGRSAWFACVFCLTSCGHGRGNRRMRSSLASGKSSTPHTCAVSPTFRYGAFSFVVFALAALSSARLTAHNNHATNPSRRQQSACLQVPNYRFKKSRTTQYREFATGTPMLTGIKHIDRFHPSADITVR